MSEKDNIVQLNIVKPVEDLIIEKDTGEDRTSAVVEILKEMLKRAESGNMTEFAAASMDEDGDVVIHVSSSDLIGAIGLYETGKHIIMTQYNNSEE